MTRNHRNVPPLAATTLSIVAVLALWQLVASLGVLPSYALAPPRAAAARLVELARSGALGASLAATLIRMAYGFTLAAGAGLLVGLAMGVSAPVAAGLRSLFLGLQMLPSAAWVPLALLLFGLRDAAITFVIVMSATPAIALATADGIAHIPPELLRAARTLGTPRLAMGTRVALPAALPGIVTGIKLGWTLGWHGVVSAELIRSSVGLGFLLHAGRELSDAAQVLGIMAVTVVVGVVLDRLLFAWLEGWVRSRWGFAPEAALA